MAKVQDQNGSVVVSIPKPIARLLEVETGDYVDYNYNKKTGKVEIFKKVKEESK